MVSISCIVYNHEKYLRKCLDSMLMQKTNFNYEILIHDDASTDGSADIIREYEKNYPDIIKPIYQKENQYSKGVKISWKYQYPRARGKYIALCEGDDYWTDPCKLQKQFDLLESDDSIIMSTHAVHLGNERGEITGKYWPSCVGEDKKYTTPDGVRVIIKNYQCFFQTSSFFYRSDIIRKVYNDIPRFIQDCKVGDYPLLYLMAFYGNIGYFSDVMSCRRTESQNSWSSKMKNNKIQKIEHNKNKIQTLKEYDEYTNHIFSKEISEKVLLCEFDIGLWEFNYSELRKPRYKELFNRLSHKKKLYIFINAYFPHIGKIISRLLQIDNAFL